MPVGDSVVSVTRIAGDKCIYLQHEFRNPLSGCMQVRSDRIRAVLTGTLDSGC